MHPKRILLLIALLVMHLLVPDMQPATLDRA